MRVVGHGEDVGLKDGNGDVQEFGVFLNLPAVYLVVARIHYKVAKLKGHIAEPLELLEKFCHEHGVFSAGDAGGNLVAGLDQPVLLYGSHKGVPERFPEFLLNAPLDHLIGFQFFFHFVSSR